VDYKFLDDTTTRLTSVLKKPAKPGKYKLVIMSLGIVIYTQNLIKLTVLALAMLNAICS
jgi:hypothetical protein